MSAHRTTPTRALRGLLATLLAAAVAVVVLPAAVADPAPTHGFLRTGDFATADTWLYGDSITVDDGSDLAARLRDEYGWDVAIDALGGRRTLATVDVLLSDLEAHGAPRRIIMAIGTNNTVNAEAVVEARADIARVQAAVPARVDVAWVTPFSDPVYRPAEVRPFYVRNSSWVSDAIRTSGYTVCDWHDYLSNPADHGEWRESAYLRDGVHTSNAGDTNGREARNELITRCVSVLRHQGAVPAPAAECQVTVPAKVAIGVTSRVLGVGYSAGCATAATDRARWDVVTSRGTQARLAYAADPAAAVRGWTVSDTHPLGKVTIRPAGGWTLEDQPVVQNTATTDVRFASRATVELRRTGTSVSYLVKARRWANTSHTYVAWSGMTGTLQYKSGDTWKNFRTLRMDGYGNATMTATVPNTYEYRVVFADLASTWGVTSNVAKG